MCSNIIRKVMAAAMIFVFLMPLSAVGDTEKKESTPVNAAVVNGKAIPYKDFEWEMQLFAKRLQEQGKEIPEQFLGQVRNQVINDMINREVIYQESQKKGIKIEPKFLEDEIAAIQQRYADPKQFKQVLTDMNLTEEKLKSQIEQRTAIRRLIDDEIASKISVTEDDAKAFYKDKPDLFQRPEEVHAQHILIQVGKDATEQQKKEARKTLADIKKRVDAGEDFGELAKAHSQCPSASNNGDLGSFPRGKMVPPFEKVAFELKPNQVSDIVETSFGYHLIKVLEHKEARTISYEEVQPKIIANLRNEKIQTEVQKYLEELRKKAKIEDFVE